MSHSNIHSSFSSNGCAIGRVEGETDRVRGRCAGRARSRPFRAAAGRSRCGRRAASWRPSGPCRGPPPPICARPPTPGRQPPCSWRPRSANGTFGSRRWPARKNQRRSIGDQWSKTEDVTHSWSSFVVASSYNRWYARLRVLFLSTIHFHNLFRVLKLWEYNPHRFTHEPCKSKIIQEKRKKSIPISIDNFSIECYWQNHITL